MRHVSHELHQLLGPTIFALGYELLGVLYIKGQNTNTLRIYIDHDDDIGVDDCARVSHQVSGILDVESPIADAYTLEISSPGIDRPLFQLAHFEKFIGHDVKIWLEQEIAGRHKITGKIVKTDHVAHVYIIEAENEYCIPLASIDKAKLAPVF